MPVDSDRLGKRARELGQVLRQRRRELGVSAMAAAEAAGLSRVTWHRMERGGTTVAFASWLAAATVLGLEVDLHTPLATASADTGDDSLPLRIRLGDFPQLRRLAWQVTDDAQTLSAREALGVYERNWRHLQPERLGARERKLIAALREVFGAEELRA